ncbi:hypothetical protein BCR32DRAFT_245401 [Anaeromyces robustus]|uniref:Tubby C-terminal domain-containing protein n=1 Tax=Anaeromyces robustus TaxID=1754192 RepID=A0A1Y1X4N7_9FUNG|nr:hypothetical protein BCR32DRAFT_245401 [Anaeromyces robustus]|eukprot:ORX80777.1 hypothetical protein BCR32DRAFT_245401 [Anaeromyces robustus]
MLTSNGIDNINKNILVNHENLVINNKYVNKETTKFYFSLEGTFNKSKFIVKDNNNNEIYKYKIDSKAKKCNINNLNNNSLVSFEFENLMTKNVKLFIKFEENETERMAIFTNISSFRKRKFLIEIIKDNRKEENLIAIFDNHKEIFSFYKDNEEGELICTAERHRSFKCSFKNKSEIEIAPGIDTLFMMCIALSTINLLNFYVSFGSTALLI